MLTELSVCLFRLAVDRSGWQPHGLFYPTCCSSGCLLSSHCLLDFYIPLPPVPQRPGGDNSCYTNASCILYPSLILCNPIRPQGGGRGISHLLPLHTPPFSSSKIINLTTNQSCTRKHSVNNNKKHFFLPSRTINPYSTPPPRRPHAPLHETPASRAIAPHPAR